MTCVIEAFVFPIPLTRWGGETCPNSMGGAAWWERSLDEAYQHGEKCFPASTSLHATETDVEAGSTNLFKPDLSTVVDSYLGELNFCLDPKDSALSGRSTTKAANMVTNKLVKNILILNSPVDEGPAAREMRRIREDFDKEFSKVKDYGPAQDYLDCVLSLGGMEGCPQEEVLDALPENYRLAFRR
ncbi:unnamed protein product [Discosporangium mesarthrocarpum]